LSGSGRKGERNWENEHGNSRNEGDRRRATKTNGGRWRYKDEVRGQDGKTTVNSRYENGEKPKEIDGGPPRRMARG